MAQTVPRVTLSVGTYEGTLLVYKIDLARGVHLP